MAKKPFPSEIQERFIVRLPDGMRDRISESAVTNNRSMNSEVVARLQSTFEQPSAALPFAVEEAIAMEQELRGGTREEAHIRLGKLALANGGTLLAVTMGKGTTFKQFTDMLRASAQIVPPDASIIWETRE